MSQIIFGIIGNGTVVSPNTIPVIFKVQLTSKSFFLLIKSTTFLNYFSEKIISIDKIPAILQAFKVVIFCPTAEHSGIWVGLLVK